MTEAIKLGNQIPTQSVILPFTKSLYKNAIENYEKSGRTAQEWQVELAKDLFAVNDDGLWVHTKFGYSIPRRNGKTELIAIREIQGLLNGEQILHTAHRTTTSHSSWERVLKLLDKAGIDYKSLKAVGRERIDIPETGGRVEFRTRIFTGGLGPAFNIAIKSTYPLQP